jgi:hypothetical protein
LAKDNKLYLLKGAVTNNIPQGFSADVAAAVPGYVLGGVASFSVPWTVGTVVGLGAIVLEKTPVFPTYPRVSLESSPNHTNADKICR